MGFEIHNEYMRTGRRSLEARVGLLYICNR